MFQRVIIAKDLTPEQLKERREKIKSIKAKKEQKQQEQPTIIYLSIETPKVLGHPYNS